MYYWPSSQAQQASHCPAPSPYNHPAQLMHVLTTHTLTAADTIPSVAKVTSAIIETSIGVGSVSINVTVVDQIGFIAFVNIFTSAVITSNVVHAVTIHVTLINICM